MDNKRTPEPDGASTLDLSGRCVGSSYILIRPIGQGATGTVWRGVDRSSGEPVAVKLLHESLLRQPKLVTRFVQERTILLMLQHRNVVRVRDLFSVGESLGLVMDLVSGGSLRDFLREHHTLAAGEAARLAAQVAAALSEAHELGVIHRDLKPDNILLLTEDGRLETRLTDFGIARVLNTPSLTTPNAVVGTPHYMSPEAFHGAGASPAADVYALGVLLYEMVSGRPPYDSENVADLMRQHLEGNPERRPGIPDEIWRVIESCLARKPRLRPAAAELVVELSDVARTSASAPALPAPQRKEPRPKEAESQASEPKEPGPKEPRPKESEPKEPAPNEPAAAAATDRPHPSSIIPAPRRPRRRNQAPNWRWARPGGTLALIAGAMLASGVATTAWHLGRADGRPPAQEAAREAAQPPLTPPTTAAIRPRTAVAPGAAPVSAAAPTAAVSGRRGSPGTAGDVAVAAPKNPVPVRPAPATTAHAAATKPPLPEAKPYGPWQCRQALQFDFSSPVLVNPCYAIGSRVQIKTTIAAPARGQAVVSVSLQDTGSGRTAGGLKTCSGLSFTDQDVTHDCGPVTVTVPHGHSYAVLMTWSYTRDGRTANGSAKGKAFAW